MKPHIKRCFICDRLLTDFGEAVVHFREIQAGGHFSDDYQAAESECRRRRIRLIHHVNQHDRELSVGDANAERSHAMTVTIGSGGDTTRASDAGASIVYGVSSSFP